MAVGAKDALSCTASTAKTNGPFRHDRGVERQFPELTEPPSAPYLQFPPYPRGGRARCAATFGEVGSLASLCPEDDVSNKQISFWLSSKGTSWGRVFFFQKEKSILSLPRKLYHEYSNYLEHFTLSTLITSKTLT